MRSLVEKYTDFFSTTWIITQKLKHIEGSHEKVENSSKCFFVLISILGRVRIATILQLHQSDVPEEISVTFDPEVDLNDNVVGRSRYKRFYSVCSNYVRENMSSKTFTRAQSKVPLKELLRVKLRRVSRLHTFQRIG